jgi:TonB family protein
MAYSPLPTPTIFPRVALYPNAAALLARLDAEDILSDVCRALASEKADLDFVLGGLAEAAQLLTGASGAAIAVRSNGVILCRGRSGEAAPALGVQLSVDSGLSGECLRTGTILRCDDTQKDFRADPEVCRQMGIRSIAAIPLRGRQGTVGVLEAFSGRPYAFSEEHMDFLMLLAQLSEAAREQQRRAARQRDRARERQENQLPAVSIVRRMTQAPAVSGLGRVGRYWATAAALAVLLLTVVVWRDWGGVGWPNSPASPAAQPVTALPEPATAPALELTFKPSPEHPLPVNGALAHGVAPSAVLASSPPDDQILATGPVQAKLPDLSSSSGEAKLAIAVSQRVTGGTLVRRVEPLYPPQAIPLRLAGDVVLRATIAENGRVLALAVTRGNPTLARAAVEAVKQWRYRPYLLNDKPMRRQAEITISFKAP